MAKVDERPSAERRSFIDRLPAASYGKAARLLWVVAIGALALGLVSWGFDTLQSTVIALWAFTAAAVALALVLPLPYAIASPLFMGIAGWLVDMLPFTILAGWTAVCLRWGYGLLKEKRMPRGGRWAWIAIGLFVWTGAGVLVITGADFKHFLLLLGIQFLISATILIAVDALANLEARSMVVAGLVLFVVVLSSAVLLEWIGLPIQELQHGAIRKRVEAAYGVDAFPNNIGMIKYARSVDAGAGEVRRELNAVATDTPGLPGFNVFRPKFQAYENSLVVRFDGSARPYEDELARANVELVFDNVGLAPANTVPRLRSFPRNALTYAGISAALLPLAFYLLWADDRRRRWLGKAGVVACLFGAAFSLARGAWAAIVIGIIYLFIDGAVSKQAKLKMLYAFLATAVVLTGVFYLKYQVDPLTGRAGGGASVSTRDDLYRDTLKFFKGKSIVFGYGTEEPRTESGTVKEGEGGRYVPRAGTHSTYLNYLFRAGLPGALMITALYVIAALQARAASKERDGDERIFATAATTAVVIAAAHAVILSLYVEPIYTLTISLIIGMATACGLNLRRSILPWRDKAAAS
jgi:O-Antigen ligase